jgi:hypothetical protein
MDYCLPRTNSITDMAILVKAEAAIVTDTTTKPVTDGTTTTDTTTKPTTDTTTKPENKPAEKPVIAIVIAGIDNRIVPRGLDSTSACTTSEECNALNRCVKVTESVTSK